MENAQLSLPFIEDELVRMGYLPPVTHSKIAKKDRIRVHRHIIGWERDLTIEGAHNMKPMFCTGVGCEFCDNEVPPRTARPGDPDYWDPGLPPYEDDPTDVPF